MVISPARLAGVVEGMDRPEVDPAELTGALRDLAWINRAFGATRVALDQVSSLLPCPPAPVRILDVGTGYADLPRAIAGRARRRGLAVRIDAVEHHDGIRERAARACADFPEIRLVRADALALPYADQSVDLAFTSQLLHHLEGEEPVRLLRELRRVARRAVFVSDLRRGVWPFLVTWTVLHLVSRNTLIRHDGPLSIRRGFLPPELAALARAAGWKAPRVRRHAFFRLSLCERIR